MIYIVDDDQYVRDGFMLLLKSAGYCSTTFKSAVEFLNSFVPGEKDLLILDMNMPVMNGCALLKNLAEKEIKLPVIVITAYDDQVTRACAKEYGALEYFRKPVDSEAIIDVLKFCFSKETI